MTRFLKRGLLSLSLLATLSGCASSSAIVRAQAVALPSAAPAAASLVNPADLAPTWRPTTSPRLTGDLPPLVEKLVGAVDSCNADKARVARDLKVAVPAAATAAPPR